MIWHILFFENNKPKSKFQQFEFEMQNNIHEQVSRNVLYILITNAAVLLLYYSNASI